MPVLATHLVIGVAAGVIVVALYRRSPSVAYVAQVMLLLGAISSVAPIKEACLTARWFGFGGLAVGALADPRRHLAVKTPAAGIVVALGLVMAVSATWSLDPRLTVERGGTVVVLLGLVFLDLGPRLLDPETRRTFVIAISYVPAVVVAASVLYLMANHHEAVFSGEFRGVLESANSLGLIVALLYPFMVVRVRGRYELASLALLAATSGVIIATSAARTGFVALLVVIAVMETSRRSFRLLALQAIVLIAAFGVAAVFVSMNRAVTVSPQPSTPTATTATTTTSSPASPPQGRATVIGTARPPGQSLIGTLTGARNESWVAAVRISAKRPVLGFGFGVADRLFARYPRIAHFTFFEGANPGSAYLTLLMELGAFGSALYLAPLLVAAVLALGTLRRPHTPEESLFPALLLAGLAAGVFETILSSAGAPWSLLVWLAGCVVLLEAAAARRSRPPGLDEEAAGPMLE